MQCSPTIGYFWKLTDCYPDASQSSFCNTTRIISKMQWDKNITSKKLFHSMDAKQAEFQVLLDIRGTVVLKQ
tara:strand:+ start:2089 stop:2304 length:216 start_codon:yes stop_codon:yes gene_type:complete